MPTAVLDVDLAAVPPAYTGLEAYGSALVLARLHGRPLGQTRVPVIDGRVGGPELRRAIERALGPAVLAWASAEALVPRPPAPPLRVTVAVCTRDRPDDVERCLAALLPFVAEGHEILVVDNCPSDDATRRVAAAVPAARYVREDRPGLSAARNRAMREAAGDVVSFIDDDAVADPGWLRAVVAAFDDPLVQCVNGLVMPLELETPAQEWQERFCPHGRGFERRVFDVAGTPPGLAGLTGVGANMSVRRTAPGLVGWFDEAIGPGTPSRTGDETEFLARVLAGGYRIVYEPAALVWHRHRRSWPELRTMVFNNGAGAYAVWTRLLVDERDYAVLRLARGWLRMQLRDVARAALRRPGHKPLELLLLELRGCAAGPRAYLQYRKRLRAQAAAA